MQTNSLNNCNFILDMNSLKKARVALQSEYVSLEQFSYSFICAIENLQRIESVLEYQKEYARIQAELKEAYRLLSFHQSYGDSRKGQIEMSQGTIRRLEAIQKCLEIVKIKKIRTGVLQTVVSSIMKFFGF